MSSLKQPTNPSNPIVYLDIKLDEENVGRIIIELRQDVVPRTANNFRCLCTGEYGIGMNRKPLHYKNTKFHKVQRLFMVQGGDVVNNDGSSGESIYGPHFEDESFALNHEAGSVGMANFGRPNTNNSQFFITTIDSPHLDGSNVVCGHILRGFGCLTEMEKLTTDDSVPRVAMIVSNSGEIKSGEEWNYCDNDISNDKLPPFPDDWDNKDTTFTLDDILNVLESIKIAGNLFFQRKSYVDACRKYKKSVRYYNFFKDKLESCLHTEHGIEQTRQILAPLFAFNITANLNIAACELESKRFLNAKNACDEVLLNDNQNIKGFYRRGQAHIGLKNYDDAVIDLEQANRLLPYDNMISAKLQEAKEIWRDYEEKQKDIYKNLFK